MISDSEIECIIKKNKHVILKFTADWCGECKKYESFIDNITINSEIITIVEIDYDLNSDLIEEYEISKLPTLIYYRNNNLIKTIPKFLTKTELIRELEEI